MGVTLSWAYVGLGLCLFVAGLLLAWSPVVWGLVVAGVGFMVVGAVRDDGKAG